MKQPRFFLSPPNRRSSRPLGRFAAPIAAVFCALVMAAAQPASAITIIGERYGTDADLVGNDHTGAGNLDAIFRAAADYWQLAIGDDHTVKIHYGYVPQSLAGNAVGHTTSSNLAPTSGPLPQQLRQLSYRPSVATLGVHDGSGSEGTKYFLDPTPYNPFDDGYRKNTFFIEPTKNLAAPPGNIQVNARLELFDPDPLSDVFQRDDMFALLVHEIGHAIGFNAALEAVNGKVVVNDPLPFAGIEIPTAGAHYGFVGANLSPNGVAGRRGLLSNAEILLVAELADYTSVNNPILSGNAARSPRELGTLEKTVLVSLDGTQDPRNQEWYENEGVTMPGSPLLNLGLVNEINPAGRVDRKEFETTGALDGGWVVRDYMTDKHPLYYRHLEQSDFRSMERFGWQFSAEIKMDNLDDFTQTMRLLSMGQVSESTALDITINAGYVGGVQGGNLALFIDGFGMIDTGFAAEQFNEIVVLDRDGDGSFNILVNGVMMEVLGQSLFTSETDDFLTLFIERRPDLFPDRLNPLFRDFTLRAGFGNDGEGIWLDSGLMLGGTQQTYLANGQINPDAMDGVGGGIIYRSLQLETLGIPEPSTMVLAGLGAMAMLRRRRVA